MAIVTLLTDFGTADHFVGVVKGVILGICPAARIVDITHEVKPFEIVEAGFLLTQSWRYFPAGTIHVAVVDPGVGTARRAILVEAGGHFFVAPDNGLLSLVFAEEERHRVREITAKRYFRHPVSQTFHGRDVFAPVAGHLAAGVAAAKFGKRIEDATRFPFAGPVQTARRNWTGSIAQIDRFGNLITNFKVGEFGARQPFELMAGLRTVSRIEMNYEAAGMGELFVIAGSSGYFEIAVGQGSAARILGCGVGAPVELRVL
jgi:S-adenosylmethionine hydrolase